MIRQTELLKWLFDHTHALINLFYPLLSHLIYRLNYELIISFTLVREIPVQSNQGGVEFTYIYSVIKRANSDDNVIQKELYV